MGCGSILLTVKCCTHVGYQYLLSLLMPFVMNWMYYPQIHIRDRIPSVTVFGDRAYEEVWRLKDIVRVGPWSQRAANFIRRVKTPEVSLPLRTQRKGPVVMQREGGCLPARKRAGTRSWAGQHPDLGLPSLRNCEQWISIPQATPPMVFRCGPPSWLIPSQKKSPFEPFLALALLAVKSRTTLPATSEKPKGSWPFLRRIELTTHHPILQLSGFYPPSLWLWKRGLFSRCMVLLCKKMLLNCFLNIMKE